MAQVRRSSRRQFIRTVLSTTAASVALPTISQSPLAGGGPRVWAAELVNGGQSARPMKLSFMTFVCPEWTIEQVVKFAKDAHYDGVEIRVDEGHKHGISSACTAETRQLAKKLFHDEGVAVAAIATSVQFACPEAENHKRNLEAAKANLDLAAALEAPVVRIFAGGGIAKLTPEAAAQVAAAFDEVGEYAKASGVCPILECGHDIMTGRAEAVEVIRRVQTSNFGVLWNDSTLDDATLADLKQRLRHFHVHDEVLDTGNANIQRLAKQMKDVGYSGYVSLEIIHGQNLPEDVLREVAVRLNRQIANE